ncbi:MAG TPA: hypothetical protein PKY45_14520 [Deltaproteobacteria bacterium]|jgi:hypothetical protein|nr:hypothetical protein [Deltaproteobacteria bacterium]
MANYTGLTALLLGIIDRIIDLIDRRRRAGAYKSKQEKADAAKDDPAGAFNAHFGGGLRGDSGDDAAETGKAGDNGGGA